MGSVQTLLILAVVMAFMISLYPNSNGSWEQDVQDKLLAKLTLKNLSLTETAIGAGLIITTVFFPNPFTLFAGVFLVLYSFVGFLVATLVGTQVGVVLGFSTDNSIVTLIEIIITLVFTLGLVDWYSQRGSLTQ